MSHIMSPLAGTNGRRVALLFLAFTSDGAGGFAIDDESKSFVESVAYTGSHNVKLVLRDKWTRVRGAFCGVKNAAGIGASAGLTDEDVTDTRVLNIYTSDGTLDDGDVLYVQLALTNAVPR